MGIITNPTELAEMRLACQDAARVLDYLAPLVKPGVTTGKLNDLALEYLTDVLKVKSATIGYAPPGYTPFQWALCTSVNHQVCHGIPGNKRLKKGDILNIDVTIIKNGWYGDTSRMFYVDKPTILGRRLSEVAYECMWLGIEQVRPGATLGDIGHAIQEHAEGHGFSVVREYCGHGIGRQFHEAPQVLHYGKRHTGMKLVPGMVFTIEPMINAGKSKVSQLKDGWTVVTQDHSLSAQWEHTVLVTLNGYEVLTISPNMPAPPALIKREINPSPVF